MPSAIDENTVQVELTDGRTQKISLSNFTGSGDDIGVKLVESKNQSVLREEDTASAAEH